ncbi:MAG: efflux RND transporter periplasmic adaptor subunit, partial [Oliverpabstia sp.]
GNGSGSNTGSTSSYRNYIGIVLSVGNGPESTVQVNLRMLNGQEEDPTAVSQYTVPSDLTVYTFSSGKCVVGTALEVQANDTLMLVYDSSTPLFGIRIASGSGQSQENSSMTDDKKESDMSGIGQNTKDFNGAGSSITDRQSQTGEMAGSMKAGADLISENSFAQVAEMMEEEIEENYGVTTTSWLSITPQDSMEITITIDEMDILLLQEGQDACVTLDAFPGQSFDGKVTRINLNGVNSGGSSKYEAVISIDRMENMLAGMNASVSITVDTKENIVMIPVEALVEDETGIYLYASYDEETGNFGDQIQVTTGISDGENVEIVSGLTEGSEYWYSSLDVVNYETLSSENNESISFKTLFGGNGRR